MNILLSFNSNYFLPALVLLRSLLLNNRWCENITVYVMYLELTEEEIRRFSDAAREFGNGQAVFVRVTEDAFADAPLHLHWISRETYYRLLAQELLPESVERILYLDVDMIVCGSLEEFYWQDFEGNLLVACCSYKAFTPVPEVLRQLTACQEGNISDEELTAARQAILSSLRATHDSPSAIEGYYATAALSGMGLTPDSYMAAVEAVTKDQVVAAARSLQLHSTYFLKGECQ